MKTMRWFLFVLWCAGSLAQGAELAGVRSVYLLPMSRGLDQYLANRLTNDHVFQIVTDPKRADAVFTDRIGEAFEAQMTTLYPPPESAKPKPDPDKAEKKDKKKKDDSEKSSSLSFDADNAVSNPALNSAFGRGRGTVFLVDVKSRQVVWSAYEPPKNAATPDKSATEIVTKLKKELGTGQ
jgi:hypothetical protein